MADPRFIGLVHSLLSAAEAALGEGASPMLTRLVRDGAKARTTAERSLSLLEMLAEKTSGQLDNTERSTLFQARDRVRELLTSAPAEDPNELPQVN